MGNRWAAAARRTWGIVGVGALVALTLADLAACRQRGRPDPEVRMAVSHERAIAPSRPRRGAAPVRSPTCRRSSPFRRTWRAPQRSSHPVEGQVGRQGGGHRGAGSPARRRLPDPALVVKADAFLPAFHDRRRLDHLRGRQPTNPAARIAVFEKGRQIFGGCDLTKLPDVHPFAPSASSCGWKGASARTGSESVRGLRRQNRTVRPSRARALVVRRSPCRYSRVSRSEKARLRLALPESA